MVDRKKNWSALWLFALLRIPFGIFTGFIRTPFPYFLRSEGLSVDRIASIISVVALPSALYFLWSPIVDFGLRRRNWLLLAALISATILFVTVMQPAVGNYWVVDLITFGFAVNLLTSAASGGLMATALSDEGRTRASGWYQAGNLGAGAFGGGLILLLAQYLSKIQVAWIAAALVFIPALSTFAITESVPIKIHGQFRDALKQIGLEIKSTFWSRKNVAGILLVMAPIGTGAAASLWVGMAQDYRVTATQVAWLNGLGGGLLLTLGALFGGLLPVHWDRRAAYVGSGILNACVSIFLWITPISPTFYFLGLGFYQLTTGICYTCFAALVFHLLGSTGKSLSSRYTIFVSLSNLPIIYMTWFEGRGYHSLGMRSVAAIDAMGNVLIGFIFLLYWLSNRRK